MINDTELRFLSVEEVAHELFVSVATARRLCVTGQLPAIKAGRAWLVEAAAVEDFAALRQSRGLEDLINLPAALKWIRGWDIKRDIWRPDVLGFSDYFDAKTTLLADAGRKLAGELPFDPAVRVRFPKSPMLFRNASDLSVSDRVAYEAVVAAMAPILDAQLTEAVYNNRWAHRSKRKYLTTNAWERFTSDVRREVRATEGWLAKSDIVSFFDFINHRILFDRLEALQVNPHLVASLKQMLGTWAVRPGEGLPQGPDASRLLANFFLAEVDDAVMDTEGVAYFRFMDDIRVVAPSRAAASEAVSAFARQLEIIGLPISSNKTVAYEPESALEQVLEDDLRILDYDSPFSLIAGATLIDPPESELRDLLASSLRETGQIDRRRATFSLHRLATSADQETLGLVLRKLEDIAPIAGVAVDYLRHHVSDADVVDRLFDYMSDRDRNNSEYFQCWIVAMLVDSGEYLSSENDRLVRKWFGDRNTSTGLRALLASLVSRSGRDSGIRTLENELEQTTDSELARGLLVALHRHRRLNARVRQRAVKRFPDLARTLRFLEGRRDLPLIVPRRTPDDEIVLPEVVEERVTRKRASSP